MSFQVTAVDDLGKGLNATASVVVHVNDANDQAPFFPRPASFSVPEDAAFGTVLGTLTAADNDTVGDNIIYSVHGSDMFLIHPLTGESSFHSINYNWTAAIEIHRDITANH